METAVPKMPNSFPLQDNCDVANPLISIGFIGFSVEFVH